MSSEHSADGHDEHIGHVVPVSLFVKVFLALVVLTVITVVIGKWRIWFAGSELAGLFDFGQFNIVLSMAIASVKAVLVLLFFMHLKYEDKITWTYVVFPIFLIFVLMAGIAIDNPFRDFIHGSDTLRGDAVVTDSEAGGHGSDYYGESDEAHH